MDINIAKAQLVKNGFLDLEIDPELDLFAEIQKLKKEKNFATLRLCEIITL